MVYCEKFYLCFMVYCLFMFYLFIYVYFFTYVSWFTVQSFIMFRNTVENNFFKSESPVLVSVLYIHKRRRVGGANKDGTKFQLLLIGWILTACTKFLEKKNFPIHSFHGVTQGKERCFSTLSVYSVISEDMCDIMFIHDSQEAARAGS